MEQCPFFPHKEPQKYVFYLLFYFTMYACNLAFDQVGELAGIAVGGTIMLDILIAGWL